MADEEVDFEEAVDLGDAPMEETAGGAASDGGKKGRDATGRRCCGDTSVEMVSLGYTYCGDAYRGHTDCGYCGSSWAHIPNPAPDPDPDPNAG